MGMSAPARRRLTQPPPAVVWHDLECGAYRADLPLWRELAQATGGPVLDVGAGTGRVALALAEVGHAVTALEREAVLLEALQARAARDGLAIETVQADARSFALPRGDYALCLVPMQTVQLLGGAAGRLAFLRHAREHLREGALLACAILGEIEPFDCSDGSVGPAPESTALGEVRYVSRAISVSETPEHVRIGRERITLPASLPPPVWPFPGADATLAQGGPADADTDEGVNRPASDQKAREHDLVVLDKVSLATLRREGEAAGFAWQPARLIGATDEHVSSEVAVLRA